MFADDTTLHTAHKQIDVISRRLQTSIDDVTSWCRANCMILNPNKTETMVVATRQKHQLGIPILKLSCNQDEIKQCTKHKLLGVIIDNELQWQPHLDYISKIISRNLYLLSKIKAIVDKDTLKLFYNAHIKPHFEYASIVWDECSDNNFKILNSLHRRTAKLLLSNPALTTDDKLRELKMLPLKEQLVFTKGLFMYKILIGLAPPYLSQLFTERQSQYANSRNHLNIFRPRIDLVKTSISYSGASLWNSLLPSVKNAATCQRELSFKTKFHIFLSNKL